jgi:hypothetical protein
MTRTFAFFLLAFAVLLLALGGWTVRGARWLVSRRPLAGAPALPAT